ncbi:GNAT family N-acetyltransferase [Nonomuraea sp. NPDC050783]|uniref:GNAT family N-acetyltransferase n=1 Tax=Nonomuraea sp. NPDC050783 TaxID=3154634 RepID=UPI003467248C
MDFDLLVHEAWPAYEQRVHDGWVLRYAGGVTKRANSVLPLGRPADLDAAIGAAEAFYGGRGQRCAFSMGLGAPPGLDEELERRGYERVDPTLVMTAPAPAPASAPVLAARPASAAEEKVRIEDRPWAGWLDTWWAVDGRYDSGLARAARICAGVPAWYGAYEESGETLAVGRAVPQDGTLGIYCMATLPQARRRGLARAVLRALVRHAGATSAYLLTTEPNRAAQALYRGEGFEVASRYHYRVR